MLKPTTSENPLDILQNMKAPKIESIEYKNSIFKEQANDIAKQVTAKTEKQISAIESIAKSAETVANSAKDKSGKADLKGWIAIAISLVSLAWNIISKFI